MCLFSYTCIIVFLNCHISENLHYNKLHSKFIILSGLETPEVDATIIILVIEFEFEYKMILQVRKCLKIKSPSFLSSKISTGSSLLERKKLKSSKTIGITNMMVNTFLGNEGFEVAAPILWNNLPNQLKSITSKTTFSKCSKTHLMINSYNFET